MNRQRMTYDQFVEVFDALGRLLKSDQNTVVYIEGYQGVVESSLTFNGADSIINRPEIETNILPAMTAEQINNLVFDKTNNPKVWVLIGNKGHDPLLYDDTRNAGLRMVRLDFPAPEAVVILTEYERGWGSKIFHSTPFYSLDAANAYVEKVNCENKPGPVPDYYIIAELILDPSKFSQYEHLY